MFHNRGLLAFFTYYLAALINDPIVLYYGVESLATPKQIAILIGILLVVPYVKIKQRLFYSRSIRWLILFYIVCVISFSVYYFSGKASDDYLVIVLASGANIVWLFLVGNVLSQGLTKSDKHKVIWGIILLGLIPLLSGYYELYLGQPLLSGGFADKGLDSFFWIRGFHIDKVDFVSGLAPGVFLAFSLLILRGWKAWYFLLYLLLSIYIIFCSYSTTGLLGLVSGLLCLVLFFRSFRAKILILSALSIGAILWITNIGIDTVTFYSGHYAQKYERQMTLENLESRNARYLMARICIREFLKSPVWGLGFGNHVELISKELLVPEKVGNAHSIISIPADLGLIGTIPFLLFWINLYIVVLRAIKKPVEHYLDQESLAMVQLSCALSLFVLVRLFFYFISMANAVFFIWPAIVYATFNTNDNLMFRVDVMQGGRRFQPFITKNKGSIS